MSNLTISKGLGDVAGLSERLTREGIDHRVVLAGPPGSRDGKSLLDRITSTLGDQVDYRGPVEGELKTAFFRDIDVFVFPTRYRHEAEPLVVFEALAHGVPVITNRRGCIADTFGRSEAVKIIDQPERFIDDALETIRSWFGDPTTVAALRAHARSSLDDMVTVGTRDLENLLGRIMRPVS